MSQKMGRPKVDNPKSVKYSIRLDMETEMALQEYAETHNISKGETIRKALELLLKSDK